MLCNRILFTTLENKARNLEHRANTQGEQDMFMRLMNVSLKVKINSKKHSRSTYSQISAKEEAGMARPITHSLKIRGVYDIFVPLPLKALDQLSHT